jgi:hypothetical protein
MLLSVIIGGMIGLAGGLLGPPLSHWLNQQATRRSKLRRRLEDLILVLYEYEHWIDRRRNIAVFGEPIGNAQSPLPKAQAVAALLFPDLVDDLRDLVLGGERFFIWMLEKAKLGVAGEIDRLSEGEAEAHRPYYAQVLKTRNKALMIAANLPQ